VHLQNEGSLAGAKTKTKSTDKKSKVVFLGTALQMIHLNASFEMKLTNAARNRKKVGMEYGILTKNLVSRYPMLKCSKRAIVTLSSYIQLWYMQL